MPKQKNNEADGAAVNGPEVKAGETPPEPPANPTPAAPPAAAAETPTPPAPPAGKTQPPTPPAPPKAKKVRVLVKGTLGPKLLTFGEVTDDPDYVAILEVKGQSKVEEVK